MSATTDAIRTNDAHIDPIATQMTDAATRIPRAAVTIPAHLAVIEMSQGLLRLAATKDLVLEAVRIHAHLRLTEHVTLRELEERERPLLRLVGEATLLGVSVRARREVWPGEGRL